MAFGYATLTPALRAAHSGTSLAGNGQWARPRRRGNPQRRAGAPGNSGSSMAQGRTLMAQAGLGLRNPVRTRPASVRRGGWALGLAAAVFGIALAAYVAAHRLGLTLDWFDLNIYNHAGLITRHAPARLYTWRYRPGVQYLYTPFAALGFAAGSLLPWAVLKWLMAVASLAAMTATVWVTFGQLGWRGQRRAAAVLAVSAVALWTEPVLRSV